MFEVVISNVNTGHVQRQSFATREAADRYVDRWSARVSARPRGSTRSYRVEVYHQSPQVVRRVPQVVSPAVTPAA